MKTKGTTDNTNIRKKYTYSLQKTSSKRTWSVMVNILTYNFWQKVGQLVYITCSYSRTKDIKSREGKKFLPSMFDNPTPPKDGKKNCNLNSDPPKTTIFMSEPLIIFKFK